MDEENLKALIGMQGTNLNKSYVVVHKRREEKEELLVYTHQTRYITAEMWTTYRILSLTKNELHILREMIEDVSFEKFIRYMRLEKGMKARIISETLTSLRQKGFIDTSSKRREKSRLSTRKYFPCLCLDVDVPPLSFDEFLFMLDYEEEITVKDYNRTFLASLKKKGIIQKAEFEFNRQYYGLTDLGIIIKNYSEGVLAKLQKRVSERDVTVDRKLYRLLSKKGLITGFALNIILNRTTPSLRGVSDYLCMNHAEVRGDLKELGDLDYFELKPNYEEIVDYYIEIFSK